MILFYSIVGVCGLFCASMGSMVTREYRVQTLRLGGSYTNQSFRIILHLASKTYPLMLMPHG